MWITVGRFFVHFLRSLYCTKFQVSDMAPGPLGFFMIKVSLANVFIHFLTFKKRKKVLLFNKIFSWPTVEDMHIFIRMSSFSVLVSFNNLNPANIETGAGSKYRREILNSPIKHWSLVTYNILNPAKYWTRVQYFHRQILNLPIKYWTQGSKYYVCDKLIPIGKGFHICIVAI